MGVLRSVLAAVAAIMVLTITVIYYTSTSATTEPATTTASPGAGEEACIAPLLPGLTPAEKTTRILARIVETSPYSIRVALDNGTIVEVLIDGEWSIDGRQVSSKELAAMLPLGEAIVVEGYVQQEICPEEGKATTIIDATSLEVPGQLQATRIW